MPAIISSSVPLCWTGAILAAALSRGMGETTYAQVRQEFEQRAARGEFRAVDHAGAGQQYTTAAMLRMEREIVAQMQEGNQRGDE